MSDYLRSLFLTIRSIKEEHTVSSAQALILAKTRLYFSNLLDQEQKRSGVKYAIPVVAAMNLCEVLEDELTKLILESVVDIDMEDSDMDLYIKVVDSQTPQFPENLGARLPPLTLLELKYNFNFRVYLECYLTLINATDPVSSLEQNVLTALGYLIENDVAFLSSPELGEWVTFRVAVNDVRSKVWLSDLNLVQVVDLFSETCVQRCLPGAPSFGDIFSSPTCAVEEQTIYSDSSLYERAKREGSLGRQEIQHEILSRLLFKFVGNDSVGTEDVSRVIDLFQVELSGELKTARSEFYQSRLMSEDEQFLHMLNARIERISYKIRILRANRRWAERFISN